MAFKNEKELTIDAPKNERTPKKMSTTRKVLPQIIAVSIKNVLLFAFGLTLGFPTILIPSLSGLDESFKLNSDEISWIGSINFISVPVGCLLSGMVTQTFGRKRAMQFVNVPFLMAWLLFKFATEVWHIYLALCLTGVAGGLLEAPVLTYVAEITHPYLRGILSATSSFAGMSGILVQFLLGTFLTSWRTVAAVCCVFPILSFILLFLVPESPHWLISKNKHHAAKKSLAWLRGWSTVDDIESEYNELCRILGKTKKSAGIDNPGFGRAENHLSETSLTLPQFTKSEKENFIHNYTKKSFLWPYALVAYCFFLGHFSGMTPLQTYAVQIFETLQSPINKYYATIFLGALELLGCLVCIILVHYVGKRVLTFSSLIGNGICYIVVAFYAYNKNIYQLSIHITNTNTVGTAEGSADYNWVPTTFILASAFLTHIGIRILPWILLGEVFCDKTRAVASGLGSAIAYICGFFANKLFLSLTLSLTVPGIFLSFAVVSFLGTILSYFILPETEGRTLHEITNHFAGVGKINNKVHKKRKKVRASEVGNVNRRFQNNGTLSDKKDQLDYESYL